MIYIVIYIHTHTQTISCIFISHVQVIVAEGHDGHDFVYIDCISHVLVMYIIFISHIQCRSL